MPPTRTIVAAAVAAVAVTATAWVVAKRVKGSRRRAELRARAAASLERRDAKRRHRENDPESLGLAAVLPDEGTQAAILDLNAHELVTAMRERRFTSVAVTATYVKRAMAAGLALNTNCEEPFEEALAAARESDARLDREPGAGAPRLLEGLPMSVKENYMVKGLESTCGTAVKCGYSQPEDGLAFGLLRDAGVIVVAHTNVPQCMMLPESANLIYGTTDNAWASHRTCGGSSGGEGAILAARGAPIGIGGDIGGSLRIPAAYNGVYTMKITPPRFTSRGIMKPRPHKHVGNDHVAAVSGPMGRCVEDLVMVLRDVWLTPALWARDCTVPPVPFDDAQYSPPPGPDGSPAPIRIGILPTNDFFEAAPANQRAVREAAELLAATPGVTVVDMSGSGKLPSFAEAARLYYGIMSADGGMKGFIDGLEGEELHPMYSELYRLSNIPRAARPALAAALRAAGKPRPAGLVATAGAKSAAELWDMVRERKEWEEAMRSAWRAAGIDALVTPVTATPAVKHGQSKSLTPAVSYCFAWNVTNPGYPAGTVPLTRVRADETVYVPPPGQRDRFGAEAARACEGSAGLPVGVQVIAEPYRCETVLRVMKMLQDGLMRTTGRVIEYPPEAGAAKL